MLHSFYKDTAPRHVRDFYLARLYRANNPEMNHYPSYDHHPDSVDDPASRYMALPRTRPRGDDGRFVPRAEDDFQVDNRDRKVCGWCRTTSTSQWRVGPPNGSVEMSTLCNACGINYRRALAKYTDGTLDLDRLAQEMGHTRLSIQKALKRQRKLSAPPHQFKRSRTTARTDRFATRAAERFPIHPRIGLSNTHSNLTMLLSGDSDSIQTGKTSSTRRGGVAALDSLETPYYTTPPAPRTAYASHPLTSTSTPPHIPVTQEFTTPSSHSLYTQSSSEKTVTRVEQSPLPPFQSFIGDIQRRTLM